MKHRAMMVVPTVLNSKNIFHQHFHISIGVYKFSEEEAPEYI